MKPLLPLCWVSVCSLSAAELDAKLAFAQLQTLAGGWQGTVMQTNGPRTTVDYRLTSGGQTVMEVLFGGTSHEMVSMYHLDGPDLVITHFCAMGNQPRMRLDRTSSSTNELIFVFSGGSNLDPAKDVHVHDGWIRRIAPDRLEAGWTLHQDGKPIGTNLFFLHRAPGASPGARPGAAIPRSQRSDVPGVPGALPQLPHADSVADREGLAVAAQPRFRPSF